jgi:HEAT repeat protein
MTAPAPAPEPQESIPVDRKSRKVYWLWGIGLTFLVAAALFCWLVVVPVWRTHGIVARCRGRIAIDNPFVATQEKGAVPKAITNLGGPAKAARALWNYARLPAAIAPDRVTAVEMLPYCGKSARSLVDDLAGLAADATETEEMRQAATEALGYIGGGQTIDVLVDLLEDDAPVVRAAAAVGLWRTGDRRALPALEARLNDSNLGVQKSVRAAIAQIKGHQEHKQ